MAASPPQVQYIMQRAAQLGLDPHAVLAVAGMEGLGGGIGDGGHAFGPFQENNAGGVLTGRYTNLNPQQLNQWAWSNQGIDDALGRMVPVAKGLTGKAAIANIVTRFERPLNPGAEIAGANARYGGAAPGPQNVGAGSTPAPTMNAGGSASRQQLAQLLFANPVNFNSNQIQAPNLALMAAMRQQASGSPAQAPMLGVTRPGKQPTGGGTAGGFLASGSPYIPGRIDQGHDFQTAPGGAIVAPGDGTVISVKSDPHGFGPSYPTVRFTTGPYAGKDVYIGHTLSALQPGQTFRAGQTISRTGTAPVGNASVPGWAEIGFSTGQLPSGQAPPF